MAGWSGVASAVIGGGFIGTVHVEALRRLGIPVTGMLASSADTGAERAAQLGLPRAYRDLDDLLADDTARVIHVTSPNEMHYPQVKALLAAGRHVVCEKPLALTSDQSAELVEMAARSGRVAAVSFNLRFYPLNLHAAEHVEAGGIGGVRLVTGHYFQDWLLHETDWNWRLEVDRGGALRAVGDIGSHWLDLARYVTGRRVESVMADLATFVPVRQRPRHPVATFSRSRDADTVPVEMQSEDAATVLLRFEGGARGALAISQLSPGRKNSLRYQVDGSSAALAWDSERPDELWIGHRDGPNELLLRNPALMHPRARTAARLPGGHVEGFADTFAALFSTIYADIAGGRSTAKPAYPTFADGHEAMLVLDAIAESARTGTWANVPGAGVAVAR